MESNAKLESIPKDSQESPNPIEQLNDVTPTIVEEPVDQGSSWRSGFLEAPLAMAASAANIARPAIADVVTGKVSVPSTRAAVVILRVAAITLPLVSIFYAPLSMGISGILGWVVDLVVAGIIGFCLYAFAEIVVKIDEMHATLFDEELDEEYIVDFEETEEDDNVH